jgi:hypothetical protein
MYATTAMRRASFMLSVGLALALALAMILTSNVAHAGKALVFQLNNTSGYALTELYVSPSHKDSWGQDILGADVLPHGEVAAVTIANGEPTCVYDVRFVADDGSMLEEVGLDFCAVPSYTLAP